MTTARTKRSWTRGEKVLAGTIVAAVVIACAVAWFLNDRDADPVVHIPTPTLPKPNGYDYFVTASDAVIDAPPMDVVSRGPVARMVEPDFKDPKTVAAAKGLIKLNAKAFGLVHLAFTMPCHAPPSRSNYDLMPEIATLPELARLLAFRARFDLAQGERSEAVDSAMDAVEMGERMLHGGRSLVFQTSKSCEAIGRRPLWDVLNSLDASACRRGTKRLEKIEADSVPFANVLQEQEWTEQAYFMEVFRRRDWKKHLVDDLGAPPSVSPLHRRSVNGRQLRYNMWLALVSKKRIMADYKARRNADIAAARRPYGTKPMPVPVDPVTDVFFWFGEEERFTYARCEAENDLLLLTFALRAYRLERGSYPASLSQLVPTYLATVPTDPFTDQMPLKYKLAPRDGYVLYSVGPDMRDDGGVPIVLTTTRGKAVHFVS